ncbi:MAG: PAS domain-containing protein [Bacteroidales bacterium]
MIPIIILADKRESILLVKAFTENFYSVAASYELSESNKIATDYTRALVFARLNSFNPQKIQELISGFNDSDIYIVFLADETDIDLITYFAGNIFAYLCLPVYRRELEMIVCYYDQLRSGHSGLLNSYQLFEDALTAVQDGICLLDTSMTILKTNGSLRERHAGCLPLEGKKCFNVFHNRNEVCENCPAIRAKTTKKMESHVISGNSPSGKRTWMELYAKPVINAHGDVTGIVEFVRNITEKMELIDSLKSSKERLVNALEGSGYGVWDWDLKTNRVFFSKQWKAMLGYNDDELENDLTEWETRVHPEDLAGAYGDIGKHLSGISEQYINEHRIRAKNGDYIWILDRGKITEYDDDGKPLRFIGTHADVTHRRKIEEKLKESEERYRKLFESMPMIAVQGYNSNREVIFWNKASEFLYGFTAPEAIGRKIEELIIPEDLVEHVKDIIAGYFNNNREIPPSEMSLSRKDGTIVHVFSSHIIFKNTFGDSELYSVDLDLTQIKRHQLIQEVLNEIVSATNSSYDLNDFLLSLKNSLSKIINTRNFFVTLYNENDSTFSLPLFIDDVDRFNSFPAGKTLTGYMISLNKPLLLAEEEMISLEKQGIIDRVGTPSKQWLGVPLRREDKKMGALVFQSYTDENAFDETDLKTLQIVAEQISIAFVRKAGLDRLKESERAMKTLISNLPGIAYRCKLDQSWTMEFLSDGFAQLTGFQAGDFINNKKAAYSDIVHPDDKHNVWQKVNQAIENSEPYYLIYRIIADKGVIKWVWEKGSGVFDDRGNVIAIEGFIIDISDRIEMEEQIIAAKEKAEESERLKSAFLSNLSHEIRSPMNSIIGFSQLLKSEKVPESLAQYVDIIFKSSHQLLNVIDDIVDMSKIDSGQINVRKESFNLPDLMAGLEEYTREQCVILEKKSLKVRVSSKTSAYGDFINTDKEILRQVMMHLINNSLKFTGQGIIEIGYEINDCSSVRFFVKDTGIGISIENHKLIFERFRQVDERSTRNFDGTGLGLSISKELVSLLGGEIHVNSTKGIGSEFYFVIPVE